MKFETHRRPLTHRWEVSTMSPTEAPEVLAACDKASSAAFDAAALCSSLLPSLVLSKADPAPRMLDCSAPGARIAAALHDATGSPVTIAEPPSRAAAHTPSSAEHPVVATELDALRDAFGASSFDVIILRGDAFAELLPDAAALPSHAAACAGYSAVVRVMKSVKQTLAPGGRLYFDVLPTPADGSSARFSGSAPSGAQVEWIATPDLDRSTRSIELRVGDAAPIVRYGLLASKQQLQAAASYAGFTRLEAVATPAECIHSGFVASFETHEAYYDRAGWYRSIWNTSGSMNWGLVAGCYPAPFSAAVTQILDGPRDGGSTGTYGSGWASRSIATCTRADAAS